MHGRCRPPPRQYLDPGLFQQSRSLVQRQAHDAGIAPFQSDYEGLRAALDGVAPALPIGSPLST